MELTEPSFLHFLRSLLCNRPQLISSPLLLSSCSLQLITAITITTISINLSSDLLLRFLPSTPADQNILSGFSCIRPSPSLPSLNPSSIALNISSPSAPSLTHSLCPVLITIFSVAHSIPFALADALPFGLIIFIHLGPSLSKKGQPSSQDELSSCS
ncbi:hypothetical protein CDL15_Pgr020125 [Punica granatum]|uniref:Uncharacterized protein n=1 Tax=Punica granatum TaxID=22663 RepID=A0A218VS30_PUNGR|nr:hypothetical protein CDL15_Pgr020125 [Punica granatum]